MALKSTILAQQHIEMVGLMLLRSRLTSPQGFTLRCFLLFFLSSLGLFILLSQSGSAQAQTKVPELNIESIPAALNLAPGETADTIVFLRNTLTETIENVSVRALENPDVNVTVIRERSLVNVIPMDTFAWRVSVTLKPTTTYNFTQTLVLLRTNYTLSSMAGAQLVQVNNIQVNVRAPQPLDQVAQVEATTTLKALNEQHKGVIYLIIRNKTNSLITLTRVQPHSPTFVEFDPPVYTTSTLILPHGILPVAFTVTVSDTAQTGPSLLLFNTEIEWGTGARLQRGNLLTQLEASIGVFGESELLTLLEIPAGIPFFLVLPGFLMVSLWRILLLFVKSDYVTRLPDWKTASFWVLAVTFSLIVSLWLYPGLSASKLLERQFHNRARDLLRGYGFIDIAWVWALAIGMAVTLLLVSFILFYLGKNAKSLVRRYLAWSKQQKTPRADAEPVEILWKLAAREVGTLTAWTQRYLPYLYFFALLSALLSLFFNRRDRQVYLPRVRAVVDGVPELAFSLGLALEAPNEIWLAPAIELLWRQDADENVRKRVERYLRRGGSAALLAGALAKARSENQVVFLRWHQSNWLTKPIRVPASSIAQRGTSEVIVRTLEDAPLNLPLNPSTTA